jgi:hypothetical protein
MTTYSNRQLKLFKRVLGDFIREYTLITNIKIKSASIKQETVAQFVLEVNNNFNDYSNCNDSSLNKITLLKDLDPTKVKIQWVSLHNLYLIVGIGSSSLNKEEIIQKFEAGRKASSTFSFTPKVQHSVQPANSLESMLPMMAGLMPMLNCSQQGIGQQGNSEQGGLDFMNNPMFSDLIKETSSSLMKSFEGKEDKLKNINPMELFNGLISGTPVIDGVDLSGIVNNLQTSINNKIEKGELNPDEIKDKAQNLISMLPDEMKNKL